MVNDPITKIMRDASEIVRYDEVGIPLSIREGLLSAYPNHRALCHWHEDIEWVYIRSGQMNYYMNGKRVLVSNHQFNWWFIISPPKGYCYCSPQRAVSQALLLARYKAVLLESSRLDSSACSFIYF